MSGLQGLIKRFAFHERPLRTYVAKKLLSRMLTFSERLELSAFPWPAYAYTQYGFCILRAMNLAKVLGYPRISILELGVGNGDGLVAAEQFVSELSKQFEISVEVYGFGLETGLPTPVDHRDSSYQWGEGNFLTDARSLNGVLKSAKLILGDVRETCPTFASDHNPAPIGCVLFDLDYYSSTMGGLTLFDSPAEFYLPRVILYFDDVQHDFIGELKAIEDFNTAHPDKKIALLRGTTRTWPLGRQWTSWTGNSVRDYWADNLYELHDFSHPRYLDQTPA